MVEEHSRISVVIIDDHPVVAQGLSSLLEAADDIEVVGVATDGAAGSTLVARRRPTVMIVDYRMPGADGIELASRLRNEPDGPKVILMSAHVDRRVLEGALDAGCVAVISKHAERQDLLHAVRRAANGDTFFTQDVLAELVRTRRNEPARAVELSPREIEVLQGLIDGHDLVGLAGSLHLSVHTVKNHLRNAMSKLEAHTKLEAVVTALRAGLIRLERSDGE